MHTYASNDTCDDQVSKNMLSSSNCRNINVATGAESSSITVSNTSATPIGPLVIVPQSVPADQQIKSNAYLIIVNPNSAFSKSIIDSKTPVSHTDASGTLELLPKPVDESIKQVYNGDKRNGMHVTIRNSNRSPPLNISPISGTNVAPTSSAVDDRNMPVLVNSMTMNSTGNVKMISQVSNLEKASDAVDPEKLERLNRALKQYKPIKKKTPFDPVISDWKCITPPRKYKRRKKNSEDRKVERNSNSSYDEASVTSMQHCLKKASTLVKSLLPRMTSPRRVQSPDAEVDDSSRTGDQRHVEAQGKVGALSRQRARKEVEDSPFERLSSSSYVVSDSPKSEMLLKENASQNSLVSLRELIMSSTSLREFRQQQNFEAANVGSSEQQMVTAELNLENLTPEILGFLRNSVDLTAQNKNIIMPGTNEMNTQETQTPVKVPHTQLSFDNGYPFLCHFDNNDIETQTESFSSFLADAFTQTNQQASKLLPDKQFISLDKSEEQFKTSESWMNNNQTQTDGINQLIADAFTQTRLGVDSNETSKSGANNIADSHTQTNLSFDNFMKNFNFGAEDDTLESHLMPDFTDMCTQTNPDPRFDLRVEELLAPLSSHETQRNNPSTPLNLSINSSHTQTVLSFDDMFGDSVGDDDVNMHDCRGNNTTYTQTSIIDDIFQSDNFTQTQFPI